jgi:hypothetical protein
MPEQPPLSTQLSSVQTLLSSQSIGLPTVQTPSALQVLGTHASSPQALPGDSSSQAVAVPQVVVRVDYR